MEIVLNSESQRKTAVGVAINKNERLFADFAINNCVKDPVGSYKYLLPLLGQKADSATTKQFLANFPYYNITAHPERGTVVFNSKNGAHSVEELVGMILEYAVDLAVKSAEQPVTSVVVTVPPFFTQAQRKAMLLAGKIASINIVQLINTNAAVAINYGVFRRSEFNETPQYVMFVDMGAGSTTASVVAYSITKKKTVKTAQLEILGVGFNQTLGGLMFDKKLEVFLMDQFVAKNPKLKKDPRADGRALAKFLKEAQRVKKILSANVETYAQIENAFEEKDFRHLVKRTDLEALVGDAYAGVVPPVRAALDAAGLDASELSHVIIVGGSTRIPGVQSALQGALGGRELGKSINADEAAALGAAYQAAVLSKGFRVKEFLVNDITAFPIEVVYEKTEEVEGDAPATTATQKTLYSRGNRQPQKKLLSFSNKKGDFSFAVQYGNLSFLSDASRALLGDSAILEVNVSNVAAVLEDHKGDTPKGIKAHFRLDESGILHHESTDAHFEVPPPDASLLSKLSSILGGDSAEAEKPAADADKKDSDDEAPSDANVTASPANASDPDTNATASDANATDTNSTEANATVVTLPKPKPVRVALDVAVAVHDARDAAAEELAASLAVLKAFADQEAEKRANEAAKNALEAFIYITKDKLTLDEVIAVSTEEERTNLDTQLSEASTWLEEEGFDAVAKIYKEKLSAVNKTARPIFFRLSEQVDRPEAFARIHKSLNMTAEFAAMVYNTTNVTADEEPWMKASEIESLLALANETAVWAAEHEAKQAGVKAHEDPAVKSVSIRNKAEKLDRELVYLIRRYNARPKPRPKIRKNNSTATNATGSDANRTKSTNTTDDEESKEAPEQEKSKSQDAKEESEKTTPGDTESVPTDEAADKPEAVPEDKAAVDDEKDEL